MYFLMPGRAYEPAMQALSWHLREDRPHPVLYARRGRGKAAKVCVEVFDPDLAERLRAFLKKKRYKFKIASQPQLKLIGEGYLY
jgi:hypothetical protein